MALSRKYYIQFAGMFKEFNRQINHKIDEAEEKQEPTVLHGVYSEKQLLEQIINESCRLFASDDYRFDSQIFWNWIEDD